MEAYVILLREFFDCFFVCFTNAGLTISVAVVVLSVWFDVRSGSSGARLRVRFWIWICRYVGIVNK